MGYELRDLAWLGAVCNALIYGLAWVLYGIRRYGPGRYATLAYAPPITVSGVVFAAIGVTEHDWAAVAGATTGILILTVIYAAALSSDEGTIP